MNLLADVSINRYQEIDALHLKAVTGVKQQGRVAIAEFPLELFERALHRVPADVERKGDVEGRARIIQPACKEARRHFEGFSAAQLDSPNFQ